VERSDTHDFPAPRWISQIEPRAGLTARSNLPGSFNQIEWEARPVSAVPPITPEFLCCGAVSEMCHGSGSSGTEDLQAGHGVAMK
jgi:hypothetical protein